MSRFASQPYGDADLDAEPAKLNVSELTDSFEELGAIWDEHGRENVLMAAVFLAGPDDHVDRAEFEVARGIGKDMTMSSAHIEGAIQQQLGRLGLSQ